MHLSRFLLEALIEEYKKQNKSCTVYALAKRLEVARPTIDRWKKGGGMSDDTAVLIAKFLNLDPKKVLLRNQYERSKTNTDIQDIWKEIICNLKLDMSSDLFKAEPQMSLFI